MADSRRRVITVGVRDDEPLLDDDPREKLDRDGEPEDDDLDDLDDEDSLRIARIGVRDDDDEPEREALDDDCRRTIGVRDARRDDPELRPCDTEVDVDLRTIGVRRVERLSFFRSDAISSGPNHPGAAITSAATITIERDTDWKRWVGRDMAAGLCWLPDANRGRPDLGGIIGAA